MKGSKYKVIVSLILVIILFFTSVPTVSAAEDLFDFDKKGSLTITLTDKEAQSPVSDVTFILYKVADISGDGGYLSYRLAEDFEESGADLEDINADGLAQFLADYASENSIQGETRTSDSSGVVHYQELAVGLYLAKQSGGTRQYSSVAPFLVSIPYTNSDGTQWIYDVEAGPKVEMMPQHLEMTVKKIWNDANAQGRPSSVTVQLCKGDLAVETVTLNDSNSWSYTWSNLESRTDWSIQEVDVPKGYTASYSISGNVTMITNTDFLPQTGQLQWPIPVLAGMGLILFAVGWFFTFVRKKRDEK